MANKLKRRYVDPTTLTREEGWYDVVEEKDYVINRNGDIANKITGRLLLRSEPREAPNIAFLNSREYRVPRLMYHAIIGVEPDDKKYRIYFKDGNSENLTIDNLIKKYTK